jgi:hypothetical protein
MVKKNDISSNDTSSNDISLNDTSSTDISLNDTSSTDTSLNDTSSTDISLNDNIIVSYKFKNSKPIHIYSDFIGQNIKPFSDNSSNNLTDNIKIIDLDSSNIKLTDISLNISNIGDDIDITGERFDNMVNTCLDKMKNTGTDNSCNNPKIIKFSDEEAKREELKRLLDKFDDDFMKINFGDLEFPKFINKKLEDNTNKGDCTLNIDNSSSVVNLNILPPPSQPPSRLLSRRTPPAKLPPLMLPPNKLPPPPPPPTQLSFLSSMNGYKYNPYTPPILDQPIITPIQIEKIKVNISREVNNIGDILKLIEDYELKPEIEYNINMKAIHNIKGPLTKLNNMIGMNHLKTNIVDQILYFVQDLHNVGNNDFMHTVISGPPGTGKTEIARHMGEIFSGLGILKYGTFRKATRSDLIAGYLGQTALKTTNIIKDCLGGVLFIDEAYALGNKEGRDSFAKEAIDTLCEALSNHKSELMVIIAGYEDELKNCFFNYNKGLESRFTWRFKTDDYSAEELKMIFKKKVIDAEWSFNNDTILKTSWFETNMCYFKYYGRDMETLFAKTKIAHSRRVFCKDKSERTVLIEKDLDNGLKLYLKNDEVIERKNSDLDKLMKNMYI